MEEREIHNQEVASKLFLKIYNNKLIGIVKNSGDQ
jgi:hypothetical protein